MINNIRNMQQRIHALNHRWWHDEQGNRLDRNRGAPVRLSGSAAAAANTVAPLQTLPQASAYGRGMGREALS